MANLQCSGKSDSSRRRQSNGGQGMIQCLIDVGHGIGMGSASRSNKYAKDEYGSSCAGTLVYVCLQCLNLGVVVFAEEAHVPATKASALASAACQCCWVLYRLYLQTDVTPTDIYDFSGLAEFVQTAGNKRLATKPRVNRHNQYQVNQIDNRTTASNGVAGLKTMPGFGAALANLAQAAMHVLGSFWVDGYPIRPSFNKVTNKTVYHLTMQVGGVKGAK